MPPEKPKKADKSDKGSKLSIICRKHKSLVLSLILAMAVLLLFVAVVLFAFLHVTPKPVQVKPDSASPSPIRQSKSGNYAAAAVAANDGLCSEIGRNVMIRGGNAVDAAIAAAMCTGVSSPQSSGIGGGLFMTIYNSTLNECIVVDGREEAPSLATSTMYSDLPNNASLSTWLAIAVPGWLHALWTAHQGYGRAPWSQIVQPTVDLLRNGMPVSATLASSLAGSGNRNDVKTWFTNPITGKEYEESEIYRNDRFANLMQQIADSDDPIRLFYDSNITESFVADFQKGGGMITRQDMRNYRSKIRIDDVLYSDLAGKTLRVCGPPPPSGAAFAMAIVNTMAGYTDSSDNVDFYHRFIESSKFAYAKRTKSGDSDFVPEALQLARDVTSTRYADATRSRITNLAQPLSAYGGGYALAPDNGTSHISVMDAEGNAVALTASINTGFGCGLASSEFGFMWNNEMDDFSQPGKPNFFGLPPSPSNYIEPGKRPQSSMAPIIAYDPLVGQARLAIGGVGGSRIISATALVTSRVLYLNDTLQYAIDAPRVHNQLLPQQTKYEEGFAQQLVQSLTSRGQNMITPASNNYVNAVYHDPATDRIVAVSDHRKGLIAFPAGY